MKLLATIPLTNGQLTVRCPPGKRIRILAVQAAVADGGANDEFVCRLFREATSVLAAQVAPPTSGTISQVSFAIGQQQNTMSAASGEQSSGLPDIWWPYDITVSVGAQTGAVNSGRVTYEEDSAA